MRNKNSKNEINNGEADGEQVSHTKWWSGAYVVERVLWSAWRNWLNANHVYGCKLDTPLFSSVSCALEGSFLESCTVYSLEHTVIWKIGNMFLCITLKNIPDQARYKAQKWVTKGCNARIRNYVDMRVVDPIEHIYKAIRERIEGKQAY